MFVRHYLICIIHSHRCTLDNLRSSEANRRPHRSSEAFLHSSVWPPPPLLLGTSRVSAKVAACQHITIFWTTFSSLTRLLDCFGDMLTANWLKRCLRVKKPAHQIKTSLHRLVVLRIPVWLVDFDRGFYVTASATCTYIIFQFIPLNDLILLCRGD